MKERNKTKGTEKWFFSVTGSVSDDFIESCHQPVELSTNFPGLGRSLGEMRGYPLQYSGLKNSMDYLLTCKELDTTEQCSRLRSDFLGGSDGKESACNAGYPGSTPGSGRSLEKEMATHSSILAWETPWTRAPVVLHSWDHKESDMTGQLTLSLLLQRFYSWWNWGLENISSKIPDVVNVCYKLKTYAIWWQDPTLFQRKIHWLVQIYHR